MLHSFAVFITGGNDINSCGIDTAVTKNVGKLCNILFDTVKHSCEQMPQVMRKHLLRIDSCLFAKSFHLSPDVGTAYGLSGFGNENTSRLYSLLRRIAEQFLLQFFHDKYRPGFPFKRYDCFSVFDSLHRYVLQFAHTNTSAANRLNRSLPFCLAVFTSRIYSALVSSFSSEQ